MSDGTCAPSVPGEGPDWLDLLCAPQVLLRAERSLELGRYSLPLLSSWNDTAGGVLGGFEAGLRGRELPDDLFVALERHVGIRELVDLAGELAETSNRLAVVTDGD